ncbi:hypothetical protein ABPG74_021036 [Tetrahymena malaccensis]
MMKKKYIYVPKSSIVTEEKQQEDYINIPNSNQEITKKQPYKKRQQKDSISNQIDNQENKKQLYQQDKKKLKINKYVSQQQDNANVDISNQDSAKKYSFKRKEQQGSAFEEQNADQENKRSIYRHDRNNIQAYKQDSMEYDNFYSSNQDNSKKLRQKQMQQNANIFYQQDLNQQNQIQDQQYIKKSSIIDIQAQITQENINQDNIQLDPTNNYPQNQPRQQQGNFIEQQDSNQKREVQIQGYVKNTMQMDKQIQFEQENINNSQVPAHQQWRLQQNHSLDYKDFNQENKRVYQQNSFYTSKSFSSYQNNNKVNDSIQDSISRQKPIWRQQKSNIFDLQDSNQEMKDELDQKIEKFYLLMIKDKKSLLINNFKILNAYVTAMTKYELPQILNFNFDQIFKKYSASSNEDSLFQGQTYCLEFSDNYELLFSETDKTHEQQQIMKFQKQWYSNQTENYLIQSLLQRLPENIKNLSLKFDQFGNILKLVQQNKDIAKNKLQQLKQLEKIHLDFSLYQNKYLDIDFNYFEILNQITSLKKLKITINQSQIFGMQLKQYVESKKFDLVVEIRFKTQYSIDYNIFNFLKDTYGINLKINMSEVDLNIYDISTIENFLFLQGDQIQSLHFIKNTFKFDSILNFRQKFLEILRKQMKKLSNLKIDNGFINIDQQAQPEKKILMKQTLEELCNNYRGNLIIGINSQLFIENYSYFETANFQSLHINFDDDHLDIQLESLRVLSQFTNIDQIKIQIKIDFENKYQICLEKLINVLQHFDKRCQLKLTLTEIQDFRHSYIKADQKFVKFQLVQPYMVIERFQQCNYERELKFQFQRLTYPLSTSFKIDKNENRIQLQQKPPFTFI